jgi:hypothetical protein
MAKDTDNQKSKHRPLEVVLAGMSVASAAAVFNFAWNFRSDVEKVVASQIHVLRPTREHIESVCAELLRDERNRTREEHREMREAINWIMRYIGTERKSK